MLTIRGLRKSFAGAPPRVLLQDINLELGPGEFIALMGESGSGKSTLLNLIAGLDYADAGRISLDDVELTALRENERSHHRRTHLGFVFQAFHLLPYLDVASNVALPLLLAGTPRRECDTRVRAMLASVGLDGRTEAKPRELSGGEMQRVAIARALVHRPKLVLADEPTGNLDAEHAQQVLALLRQLADRAAAACILVTHSVVAAGVADRVYALSHAGLQRIEKP
jgi:putative ABC transport system ATP-binding protein